MKRQPPNKSGPAAAAPMSASTVSLATLFWIFFRIACTSFGGFMAMIAVVQNVVVERRRLLAQQDMLDGISLASVLPGPVAVNVVVYVGYRLRGGIGALVSGVAAVLPAFVLIVLLSFAYFEWGRVPAVAQVFAGFIPAVIAIIVAAAWNMGRQTIVSWREAVLAAAAAAVLLGIGGFLAPLAVIAGAGALGWLWFRGRAEATHAPKPRPKAGSHTVFALVPVAPLLAFAPALLLKLFLTFAGMSLMLFGGAYVFIPIIQETVVDGLGWVSTQEFIDAVALGQITPGPVLVSAAFIGFKVAGLAGAFAATAGIFVPAAAVMIACSHGLERIKRSPLIAAALHGIRPAVVGMIAAAAIVVARSAAPVWASLVLFVVALVALLRFRVEAVWLIPPAGLLGLVLY